MNDLTRFRALCEALLRDLSIPDPFEIEAFCAEVAAHRGRPLRLLPLPLPASRDSTFGVWVQTDEADFVLHEQDTTPLHRDQIVLHEVAHMMLGHQTDVALDPGSMTEALPDLAPAVVRKMLSRDSYGTVEEEQAEWLGTLILERGTRKPRSDGWLSRLGDALQHPRLPRNLRR